MTRSYNMTKRAKGKADTVERIIDSTEHLIKTDAPEGITLQAIAQGAGVTVQTVLRHMGSRDACLESVAQRVKARVEAQRGNPDPKDIHSTIQNLVTHYEEEGALVLNLLKHASGSDPFYTLWAESGRSYHRGWVKTAFSLDQPTTSQYVIDALVIATDLSAWKLLRHELNRSKEETFQSLLFSVNSLLGATE